MTVILSGAWTAGLTHWTDTVVVATRTSDDRGWTEIAATIGIGTGLAKMKTTEVGVEELRCL